MHLNDSHERGAAVPAIDDREVAVRDGGICCAGISVVSYLNRKRLCGDRFYELIVESEPFCLR
jgi:hypothetical protein